MNSCTCSSLTAHPGRRPSGTRRISLRTADRFQVGTLNHPGSAFHDLSRRRHRFRAFGPLPYRSQSVCGPPYILLSSDLRVSSSGVLVGSFLFLPPLLLDRCDNLGSRSVCVGENNHEAVEGETRQAV